MQTHQVQTAESQVEEYPLFTIANEGTRPVVVTLRLDDREIDMEVDTGAAVSLISATTYQTLWAEDRAPELFASSVKLRTYTREVIEVLGAIEVDVRYMDLQERLRLLVVAGDGPSLFGRDWLRKFDWKELNFIHRTPQVTPRVCKPLQIPLHGALLATPETMASNADIRSVLRGSCRSCTCDGYLRPGSGAKCEGCGHPPGKHENLSAPPTVSTDGSIPQQSTLKSLPQLSVGPTCGHAGCTEDQGIQLAYCKYHLYTAPSPFALLPTHFYSLTFNDSSSPLSSVDPNFPLGGPAAGSRYPAPPQMSLSYVPAPLPASLPKTSAPLLTSTTPLQPPLPLQPKGQPPPVPEESCDFDVEASPSAPAGPEIATSGQPAESTSEIPQLRRSGRVRQPPDRFSTAPTNYVQTMGGGV